MDDRRTKTLAIAFGVLLVLWLGYKAVYPRWIEPLVKIDDEIQRIEEERDALLDFQTEFENACTDYTKLASRVGTMDWRTLRRDLHERIERIGHAHGLTEFNVTPKNPRRFGRTECTLVSFQISGQQKLTEVLGFFQELYTLPQVMRIVDPKLIPIEPPRGKKAQDVVKLSLELRALLLPGEPMPGKVAFFIRPKDLGPPPERHVRGVEVDTVMLAMRKPFLDWEQERVVTGGPKGPTEPSGPVKPSGPKRWTGRWKLIAVSLMHNPELATVLVKNESVRVNNKKRVSEGGEFDGGKLVAVDTRGVLVRRWDGDFVYRLGEPFSGAVPVDRADKFPGLQRAAEALGPRASSSSETRSGTSKTGSTGGAVNAPVSKSTSGLTGSRPAPVVGRSGSASGTSRSGTVVRPAPRPVGGSRPVTSAPVRIPAPRVKPSGSTGSSSSPAGGSPASGSPAKRGGSDDED